MAAGLSAPVVLQAQTVTFVCDYKTNSDEEGLHSVNDPFVLTFLMDTEEGNSYVLGNLGAESVVHVEGDGAVTFIETTGTKNVMTTTVTKEGRSVHSRNSVILGSLVASQYYGSCTVDVGG